MRAARPEGSRDRAQQRGQRARTGGSGRGGAEGRARPAHLKLGPPSQVGPDASPGRAVRRRRAGPRVDDAVHDPAGVHHVHGEHAHHQAGEGAAAQHGDSADGDSGGRPRPPPQPRSGSAAAARASPTLRPPRPAGWT